MYSKKPTLLQILTDQARILLEAAALIAFTSTAAIAAIAWVAK